MTERITAEQLHELDRDEQAGMLFFMTGYLKKNAKFQEGLSAAYADVMRQRDRKAANGARTT